MHISIIILLLDKTIGKIIKAKKTKNMIVIAILIIYNQIINQSISSTRSILMAIIYITSKLVNRKSNFLVTMSIASIFSLVSSPYNLINSGFLLSYAASLGIVLILPKITVNKFKNKIISYIYNSILVSISANILIFPIIIDSFKKISLSMLIVQIILTPFLYIIEILGILSIFIPKLALEAIKPIIESSIQIFDNISKIRFMTFYTKVPSIISIITYYIFIITYILKPSRKIIKKILKTTLTICIIVSLFIELRIGQKNSLEIYMIDVSQGDSTLIITRQRKTILIDGGGNEEYDIGKNVMIPYLLNKKINKLDYIIISHFDTDHIRPEY